MRKIEVNCDYCGGIVLKPVGEYNRRIRLGKCKFYCNNKCGSKVAENVERLAPYTNGQALHIKGVREGDDLSPFRLHMKCIKNPDRKKKNSSIDFDIGYLKEVWDSQDGICPFAGIKMSLRTMKDSLKSRITAYCASVDRIDNSIGYVRGNIRFVCHMANMARNKYSDEQVIEFCRLVAANRIDESSGL
jgi:hypothetical protein